jgi:hypothetical protein|tara:strand:+ start:1317 stop:2111 length:795 start_codon:yes stop_codon:yes gene_type:complete
MPKQTLLEITQHILSSMDSDSVNSFAETVESEQVAFVIKDAYFNMINNLDIPEHYGIITLTALGDTSQPTHMLIPDGVRSIQSVKYNVIKSGETRIQYDDLQYREPENFLDSILSRNSTDSNIQTVSITGGKLFIENNKRPEYYTSFDDQYLVFDSFDSGVDSTLQQSKFMVRGALEPVWTMADSFVPDLDANLFPLFINEAKSLAFVEIKQSSNPKAEQYARRQWTRWANDQSNIKYRSHMKGPDYGRRSRGQRRNSPILHNS